MADKPNRTLKDLTRVTDGKLNVEGLRKEVSGSSDRALALVVAAHVDATLQNVIVRNLKRKDSETTDNLFRDGGSLGTFSNKIALAYAYGYIDNRERKIIDAIRRVRNVFAHSIYALTFDEPAIADLCVSVKDYEEFQPSLLEMSKDKNNSWSIAKQVYFVSAMLTSAAILNKQTAQRERKWREERERLISIYQGYYLLCHFKNITIREIDPDEGIIKLLSNPKLWFYSMKDNESERQG